MDTLRMLAGIDFATDWWILALPASLMLIDILTGVIHAWTTGHLKSYRMREGLGRKCGELIALIAFELLTIGLNLPKYVITGISVYIIFMELVSLLENLEKLGVPLPSFVLKALGVANDILDGKDEEELSPETKEQIEEAIRKLKKEG